MIHQIIKEWM